MKKLTEAQQAGLEYLGQADIPSDQRTLSRRYISTPRTNTLVKLAELGLAEISPLDGRYLITDAGRAVL